MWQLGFKAAPGVLPQLEHGLKVSREPSCPVVHAPLRE